MGSLVLTKRGRGQNTGPQKLQSELLNQRPAVAFQDFGILAVQ